MPSAVHQTRRSAHGVALLPTLMVLALLTIVVVLFFSLARIQLQSSADHTAGYDLRHLQDTAVNLALGQIRDSSTQPGALWVSQPGAIRTYARDSGQPAEVFKLYSAPAMRVPASSLASPAAANLAADVPPDWDAHPGTFADLNRPSVRTDGTVAFPVVDPRALDPAGTDTPEGFSFSASHAAGGGTVPGVVAAGPESSRRLPMPVAWIYLLADGSLGTLDTSGKFAPFPGQRPATRENPIVGRIAFWTDDESAKVNINTASEAIFWDTPRCATPEDVAYAKAPPAKNEVQRFGGHPATTCLSSVLLPNRRLDPADSDDADSLKEIYRMAPRITADGGLLGGGGPVPYDDDRLYPTVDEFLLDPDHAEQPFFSEDPARLRKLRFFLTANSRAPEITAAGSPRVAIWPIHWRDEDKRRTSFDRLAAFCSTLDGRPYFFRRNGANTNIGEYNNYYVKPHQDPLGFGLHSNAELLSYLISLGTVPRQGYPLSIEDKYDPVGTHSTDGRQHNLATGLIGITEYLRQTNLHDSTLAPNGRPVIPYSRSYYNWAWGTEIYGQVTNIEFGWLPGRSSQPTPNIQYNLRGDSSEVRTNGIGRELVASEVGIAFCLAAEHRPGGSKFNPDLVDLLQLPAGFKAVQISPLVEGFVPAQGYTMIAPSSSARVRRLETLRLDNRRAGGVVQSASPLNQSTHYPSDPIYEGFNGLSIWNRWGHIHVSAAYMRNLAPGDPPSESRYSDADWWVGWGGSGGRHVYTDTNTTNWSSIGKGQPDLDAPTRRIPSQYSRGYFIVESDKSSVALTSTDSRNELYFEVGNQRNGDFAGHVTRIRIPAGTRIPVPGEPIERKPTWGERYVEATQNKFSNPEILDPSDVVRTWVSRHGDHRLQYVREREEGNLPPEKHLFVPHPDWDPATAGDGAESKRQIHSFTQSGGEPEPNATFHRGLVRGANYPPHLTPDFTLDPDNHPKFAANRPNGYPYSLDPGDTRDWNNGTGIAPDGAYWGKVDDVAHQWEDTIPPYFSKNVWDGSSREPEEESTAPNQQMPSGVVFGSINSAAFSGLQWTTYLFRPDITPGGHLGAPGRTIQGDREGAPPDHTILDWFWMPVVQPYAVSEPFSTKGKINMNYRIAPFTYIKRATGLHAVLKSERILSIPTSAGQTYKNYASRDANTGWRQSIDAETTLLQWEDKFDKGEFFMNPSEVCEQFLVPENKGLAASDAASLRSAMTNFWRTHGLTGDNVLERPYANIYPRLTTRSNSYRVHFLVQTIKKARSTEPDTFDPERDSITGESQGDALVERAIDPNDPMLQDPEYDYIANPDALPLDNLYTYRIRHIRRFSR